MGTGIKRVQAALVVLMLAILGFLGTQPAVATETEPGPGTETGEPIDPGTPTEEPVVPPVVVPPVLNPPPPLTPLDPAPAPAPVVPPAEPSPVVPPVTDPVAPPAVEQVAPVIPAPQVPAPVVPAEEGIQGYVVEPEVPTEDTTTAQTESSPSPTPTPAATKTATPAVASADIAGPLKVALAPVSDNNPVLQGITVLVLILLGVAYFRALRSKGVPGPRLNGK